MNFQILTGEPDRATLEAWQDFLTRADFPCHYATPAFFSEPHLRNQNPFVVLVRDGSRIVAVASGIRDGRMVECGLQSRPQLAIDPTADRERVADALATGLVRAHEKSLHVRVTAWSPIPELKEAGFVEHEYAGEAGIVLLDLRRGPEALFQEFSESRRNNIRKAIRRGVTVEQAATEEDLQEYYPIYSEWSRSKHHTPAPYELIREVLQTRSNRRLFLAKHDGATVAGVIVRFHPGGVVEFAANSSYRSEQTLKPNDLLHWRIIEWACAEGFVTYGLGGAHLFLRRFGGRIISTYEYRLDRTIGKRFEMRRRLFASAHASWKRLPEPVRVRVRSTAARLQPFWSSLSAR